MILTNVQWLDLSSGSQGSEVPNLGQCEGCGQSPDHTATKPTHVCVHYKKSDRLNLNLPLIMQFFQTAVHSRKGQNSGCFGPKEATFLMLSNA
jgi:hypothetical protein